MNAKSLLSVAIFLGTFCSAYADYAVSDRGEWPETWPKELEPLRNQAKTMEGPLKPYRRYLIPFTRREEFEAAWPHLLKAKSKGAPIILVRGPRTDFFAIKPAGVMLQSPPHGTDAPETPLAGKSDVRTKWRNTTFMELAVDGEIVDLNRLPLPPDTPIVDERFKDDKEK